MLFRHILFGCLLIISCGTSPLPSFADGETSNTTGWRQQLRDRFADDQAMSRYGLTLDERGGTESLVVFVHGYNSSPAGVHELIAPAREADLWCGVFAYPNDQPIAESARLFSRELADLASGNPTTRVTLVTHSMGGLVARAAVEDPSLDPGNVNRLILIAPPTHGSLLAKCAVGTDLWEHWISRSSGSPWRRFKDSLVDGLGEAADDLRPGSPFLRSLNSRERNPRVAYTLVLGGGGSISGEHHDWVRSQASSAFTGLNAPKTGKRFDKYLLDYEECVCGKGDGVVALKRARLDGVEDVVVLPFGHLDICSAEPTPAAVEARKVMLNRLLNVGEAPKPTPLRVQTATPKQVQGQRRN